MPRKKGKKRSGAEEGRESALAAAIPGLTSARDLPSSSREQPPAVAGGRRQGTREQAPVPAQLPKPKQPEPSYPGKSDAPSRSSMRSEPSSSGGPSATESSHSELSRPFRELAIVPALPKKPQKPGRLGRPISLISNCYPLRFDGRSVYHYDIEVKRIGTNYTSTDSSGATKHKEAGKKYRCMNTQLNRKVFKQLSIENFDGSFAVYDGKKNVYSIEELPIGDDETMTCEVRMKAENPGDSNDPRGPMMDIFQVTLQPVRKESGDNIINLEPLNALFRGQTTSVSLDAIMVLETVLRHVPCMRFVPVGRNFFTPPNLKHPLGNGKEVWFGHHQSVRLAQMTPVVNLDIAASSFYENIPVIEYIEKLRNIRLDQVHFLQKDVIDKINKDIRNLQVETTHQHYRRKYTIEGLSEKNANQTKFKTTENNQECMVTVESYYKNRYNVRLKYPHVPCLKVKKRDIHLPMEVCEIVKGQHSNRELNPKQQAEMIKYTCKPPRERFSEIDKIYKNSKYDKDPYLQSFGLRVIDQPLMVDGRTMEAPNLIYRWNSNEIRERPKFGSWNMRDKQFFTGTEINRWTLVSFADKNECHFGKLKLFAGALEKFSNQQGIKMNACSRIEIAEAILQSVKGIIEKMKDQYQAKLVFIVLPADNQRRSGKTEKISTELYSEVKRIAETNVGIVTQCVKGENVVSKGTNPSFVTNLCLKMNAKMGGINNSMVPAEVSMLPNEPILFVGADVNHPAPTENTRYSLAALVGNLDTHPSRYAVIVRAQKNEKNTKMMVEVILNMTEMMKKLLLAYYVTTRMKPKKIIVYRDGVSDGQFSDVQTREIKYIRDACTCVEAGYRPGITFVVVQKRHHVRFLPERRMDNPPPGTVVDTTVTHPLNFDFFLYSHNGLKGTSRPSYYTVLADDNKFSFDALEKMTYSLCYTYVRCTKSISLPAPVQYADLAAYRARRHLNSHLKQLNLARDDEGKFDIEIREVQKIIDVKECMKDTMYYA